MGRLVYCLDWIVGGLSEIQGFWVPPVRLRQEGAFIEILQQFQTSSVRHQAHTDQSVENGGQTIKSESVKKVLAFASFQPSSLLFQLHLGLLLSSLLLLCLFLQAAVGLLLPLAPPSGQSLVPLLQEGPGGILPWNSVHNQLLTFQSAQPRSLVEPGSC